MCNPRYEIFARRQTFEFDLRKPFSRLLRLFFYIFFCVLVFFLRLAFGLAMQSKKVRGKQKPQNETFFKKKENK